MPSPEQNQRTVLAFFKAWEKGTFDDLAAAYTQYLSADVIYENSGVPPCRGIEESVAFIRAACSMPSLQIQSITVAVRSIAAAGNLVFTERTDFHYNAAGEATLVPELCGVMEFDDAGKIRRWADYFDPGPMLAAIA
jgi:limonene-1,2-epoxide hydrolase